MTTMPNSYYNQFDSSKNYERILYRDGYTLQGAELNAQQTAELHRLKGVADALFKDGHIIRDAQVLVNKTTGAVQAGCGAVYLRGAVRSVPGAQFVIPVTGTVTIGIRLIERVISELEDASLYNPAIGSRGEGEPGAWRLRVNPQWGFDGDGGEGEFYPVYVVDEGMVRPKEAPPTSDAFTQSLARYDRDSTAGGSYVVHGLTVLAAADEADGDQVYTISEGRARVNGYGVELPTSCRLTYAARPDLREIYSEVHIADGTSVQPGGQRLTVAQAPLWSIDEIRITTRKTVTLTHGPHSGAQDALPDTSVVAIVECRQGETVYAQGADYRRTGDKVDWSPTGAEPAPGSTYQCTYDHIVAGDHQAVDADGFSVTGAVEGSSIIISYKQALPRLDRLGITAEGRFQWIVGVGTAGNPSSPVVPPHLLPIATVHQTWRNPRRVVSDGVRVVAFSEIDAINRRIDYAIAEIARQRLEADVYTRESGARVGIFVDPLLDDSMRDQGIPQTAAVVDGELILPISVTVTALPQDVTAPTCLPYNVAVLLEQTLRTGSMLVNPYMAFEAMPAIIALTPAVDFWTVTNNVWLSDVTRRITTGWGNRSSTSVTTSTALVSTQTTKIEHLRPIEVTFDARGFGPGEVLQSVFFDGIQVQVSPV